MASTNQRQAQNESFAKKRKLFLLNLIPPSVFTPVLGELESAPDLHGLDSVAFLHSLFNEVNAVKHRQNQQCQQAVG